jgi:hypothetical protein
VGDKKKETSTNPRKLAAILQQREVVEIQLKTKGAINKNAFQTSIALSSQCRHLKRHDGTKKEKERREGSPEPLDLHMKRNPLLLRREKGRRARSPRVKLGGCTAKGVSQARSGQSLKEWLKVVNECGRVV